ncbi:flavin reductase family protein [Nitratifractor sp.]
MLYEYDRLEAGDRYKLMAQSVVPRPIAWIVSESEGGIFNVAPFSYFTPLSSEPPTLIVSVGHRPDGRPKDTLHNLRERGRCTLCLPAPEQIEAMHYSSKPLEPGEGEAERFGIALTEWIPGFPPRIAGAPTAFACRLLQEVDLPGSKTRPLILEIVAQYLEDGCVTDPERLRLHCETLARVGAAYATLSEPIPAPEIP